MSFIQFVNSIFSSFNSVFNFFVNIFDLIIENPFIKIIIILSLLSFILWLVFEIPKILYTIINNGHDKNEQKKLFNSIGKNKEIKANTKGMKKINNKDIWW